MIKIFDGEDKVYSTNGNLVVNPTLAKVHKADNGDFYLDLETPLIENEKERAAETGTYITGTSFTIQNYDSTKLVELTELDGNTTQNGTPTPSSPQPINVVSGRQEVSVVGKNLFNPTLTINGTNVNLTNCTVVKNNDMLSFTATAKDWYFGEIRNTGLPYQERFGYLIEVEEGEIYSFTISNINIIKNYITYYDENKISLGTVSKPASSFTYTIPSGAKYITLRIGIGQATIVGETYTTTIQIEKGSTATTYEEYKGQSYEINLGKNLINYVDNLRTDWRGLTSTINSDGSITTTGIPLYNYTSIIQYDITGMLENGAKYTLWQQEAQINVLYLQINITDNNGGATQYASLNNSTSVNFTADTINKKYILNLQTGTTANWGSSSREITNYYQLEKGSQATTYTSYKTPIELCKIGDYQDFIKKGTGKNINSSVLEVGSISNGENVGNYFTVRTQDYIEVKPNTNYAFSINGTLNRVVVSLYDINKNYIATSTADGLVSTTGLFTTFANAYYIRYRAYNADKDLFLTGKIQLEEGNQATLFEPYGYKDKWYLYKTIGKVVLNGSESWVAQSIKTNTTAYALYNSIGYKATGSNSDNAFINYFKGNPNGYNVDEECFWFNGDGYFRLRISNTLASTVANFKTWLSTHNTIVYYVLATPTTTEITDSELISQLNSIELLEGLNNVSVSSADLPSSITLYYNYLDGYKNITKYIDYLVPNNIIVANTPQGEQAFRITNVEKTRRKIKIKAYHVFYDSENLLIEDSYVVDKNCNDALDHLNNATSDLSPFTTISNINTIANYRCVRKSLYEAIKVVLERWGGHLVRDNWSIGIYDTIGQDNGVTIRYAKNLKEMTATYDWDDVVTKLLPVGKDGILLNELDPTASLYVESALKYDIPYTKTISFEQNSIVEDDYKDEFGEVIEEEYKQALIDDLFAQATEYINNNYLPKVNYTLSANVEKVSDVGDSIEVIDEKLGINIMTNIISYDYDCILNRYLNLEFGNFTPTLNGLIDTITNNTEKLIQEENSTLAITLGRELDEATSKIWSALGNSYVIYDGDKILVVDSLPKETATNVIMINNGGIGFSNTGITGTFSSAWTIDNVLNMENINVINLTADLVKGGTLKLGSNLNQNGKLEVYDEANNLIAELNKNGLKMYGVDGSYVLMNNQVGFAGYDRNNNPVYWVSKDEFHMKKSVVEEEITLVNKMRIIPITIRNGNTIVNDGIGFINVPN